MLGNWTYGATGVGWGGVCEGKREEGNDAEDIHEQTVVTEVTDRTDTITV